MRGVLGFGGPKLDAVNRPTIADVVAWMSRAHIM